MSEKPHEKGAKPSKHKRKSGPAARAIAEAEQRRKARKGDIDQGGEEVGGRAGLDPVRYGDWEKDGTISDF